MGEWGGVGGWGVWGVWVGCVGWGGVGGVGGVGGEGDKKHLTDGGVVDSILPEGFADANLPLRLPAEEGENFIIGAGNAHYEKRIIALFPKHQTQRPPSEPVVP